MRLLVRLSGRVTLLCVQGPTSQYVSMACRVLESTFTTALAHTHARNYVGQLDCC